MTKDEGDPAARACRAIEDAFSRLPRASDDPVLDLIPGIAARHLIGMRREPRSAEEEKRVRELPPVMPPDSLSQTDLEALSRSPRPLHAKENKELQRVRGSISCALEALAQLSPIALDALNREVSPLFLPRMKMDLATLLAAALKVQVDVKAGQPKKTEKLEIAWQVGTYFCWQTGKKPTVINPQVGRARGPFLELLETVFKIRGIEGGAVRQANEVSDNWYQRPRP